MRVTKIKLPCRSQCKVLPLTSKLECYYNVIVANLVKKWLTFDVETLNNLCERRCITSLMSHLKVDIAVLFGQEIVHYILCFSFSSIITLTELLQANSLRKCVLCELISYVRNI